MALKARITPACAGRRDTLSCWSIRPWDHPRVRGEKELINSMLSIGKGSPPRARGEGIRMHTRSKTLRITPACAGRRQIKVINHRIAEDHPRVRGEKATCSPRPLAPLGSPPRARGEVDIELLGLLAVRITPACAGRSPKLSRAGQKELDHPRVRGEKFF